MNAGDPTGRDHDAYVDKIFNRALDLTGEERASFLDRACGQSQKTRDKVERLLALCDDPPSLLAGTSPDALWPLGDSACLAEQAIPPFVGPYRILKEIGHGGMGVVYLGMRSDGHFEQKVAIKIMRPGSDGFEARNRFEQERQIIASLQHPNIARLYDGGVTDEGQPYSVMEFIDGQRIDAYCDERKLTPTARMRLVEVVANAVHFAHQNLVVHCDLKPSNILVTPSGEIKLLDFGIAKLLDTAGSGRLMQSRTPLQAVTPLYASPEQLRREPLTTASDIYQLGLLLFELITGQRAREPATPSSEGARPQPRNLPTDLDLIIRTALRDQPSQRYPSAAELMKDLEHYRRGRPVTVGPRTLRYRVRRFVGRNRLAVAGGSLLLVLLIGYALTVTFQAQRIREERDRAQRVQAFALGAYGAGDPNVLLGPELTAANLVARGVARANAELADEPEIEAEVKHYLGRVYHRLGHYPEAEALLREVVALQQEVHGDAHPAVASALHELGHHLLERDTPEALALLEQALEQRRRFLGIHHPDSARTLVSMAFYLRAAGRLDEAEDHFRQALAIQRSLALPEVEIASTLSGLGWTVRFLGRPEEAEPLVREALVYYRDFHGELHPEVARGWNNLATVLWQLEKWEEGDAAIQQSIDAKKRIYGERHPDIATSLGNLAGSLLKRGKLQRAADLYREAMDIRIAALGPSHPRVAQSTAQLAEVLHQAGALPEAELLFGQALEIFQEHLPADHPSLARTWRGLGTLWLDTDKLEPARRALHEARDAYVGFESTRWPPRVDVLLAELHRRQGRAGEARALLDAAEGKLEEDPEWVDRWRREKALLAAE